MFGTVSVAAGLICAVAAVLIATVGRMQWPRVTIALTLTAAAGILNGTIGPWIHGKATMADQTLGHVIGRFTGTVITGLVGVVVLSVAGFWVYQRRIDTRTLAVVAAVPATVTLIPGMLGTIAVTVVGIVPAVLGTIVAWLFGIR